MTAELLLYPDGQPSALLVLRPWGTPREDHWPVVALADREALPAFLVIHRPDFSEQIVVPLNRDAEALFLGGLLDRLGWESFLHHVRGLRLPAEVLCNLGFCTSALPTSIRADGALEP
jgi:hypothetical protein